MVRLGGGVLLVAASGCIPRLYTEDGGQTSDWVAPENGWSVTEPPPGLVGEGYEVGEVVPDFLLRDQFGDDVSLWQFYGSVVLMDVSTIWCEPCRELASHAEEVWQSYRDDGFVHVTVLHQDNVGQPPDLEDLDLWVTQWGLTSPVLADGDEATGQAIRSGQYPTVLLIGRGMKVRTRLEDFSEAAVRDAIESAL